MLWLPVILTSPHLMWTHVACLYDNVGIALTSQLPKAAFHLFVCSVCHRAPLCLTHYTPTHTRLIPTQTLFSLRKVHHVPHLQSRGESAALERYTETPRVPGQPWVHLPRLFSDLPSPFTPWKVVQNSFHTGWHHQTDFTHRATTDFVFQHEENCFVPSRHENGTQGGWMEQGNQPDRNESVSVTSPHHGRTVLVETDQTKTLFPRAQKEQEQRSHKNKQNKELKCEKMNSSFSPLPHIGIFPSTHESLLSWELRVKSMNSDTSQLELKAKLYCLFASVSSVPLFPHL